MSFNFFNFTQSLSATSIRCIYKTVSLEHIFRVVKESQERITLSLVGFKIRSSLLIPAIDPRHARLRPFDLSCPGPLGTHRHTAPRCAPVLLSSRLFNLAGCNGP